MAKFTEEELARLDLTGDMPRHIGIIMDGNGRWAKAKGMPRAMGHRAGMGKLHEIVETASDVGVEVLTVYAFSTENWKRPADEVSCLFSLLIEYFAKEIDELDANGVRVRVLGDIASLPARSVEATENAVSRTKDNKGLTLCIAINYGGRAELAEAVRSIAEKAAKGLLSPEAVDEATLADELYTAGLPDPDLIIRTAGEERLSNFLLYQSAYAELVFSEALWPDFGRDEFLASIRDYQRRSRRFGGVK